MKPDRLAAKLDAPDPGTATAARPGRSRRSAARRARSASPRRSRSGARGDIGVNLPIGYSDAAARSVARGVGCAAGRPRRPLTSGPPAPGLPAEPGGARPPAPPRRYRRVEHVLDRRHRPRLRPPGGRSAVLRRVVQGRPGPPRRARRRQRRRQEHAAADPGRRARADEGEVARGGRVALHAPGRRRRGDGRSASCCCARARAAARRRASALLDAERALAAGDDDGRHALGEAIGDWSELGGYELEGQWDAACRRIVRAGFDEVGDRPATTLSGGERKRLVLDVAVRLRRRGPAARRARQLPRHARPSAWLEQQIARVAQDHADHQPRPRAARRRVATRSSRSRATARWVHGDSYATYAAGARAPPGAARRRARALEGRGAPPVPAA